MSLLEADIGKGTQLCSEIALNSKADSQVILGKSHNLLYFSY